METPGPRTGTRFGPYELRSMLGKGGMGEVYEAYDTAKGRVVALKLLHQELAGDPVYQVRFRRESQAAARIAEPHIIPIHDWGVIDGVLFIDMLRVPGVDLRTLLRKEGPLSPIRAVGIIEQIAGALDAAHAGGLVHRDVKPANILVTAADFAYLVDFGLAHTEGDSAVTMVGTAVGSYIYMAPERFDVSDVTGRADIYSLACVLHECLTGASPFPAASMNVLIRSHLSDPPPRPSRQDAGIPAGLDTVIARGMAKNPADRWPTASAMAGAARAALTGAPIPGVPAPQAAEPAPQQAKPAPPPPPTGPMLVVRAPEPSPESTGEISAVIRLNGPTVVSATETQFMPLTSEHEVVQPFAPPPRWTPDQALPPMRPFPDAHLYSEQESQGYSDEPAYPAPAPYSNQPGAQGYPDAQGYQHGAQAYSEHPETQAYADPQAYSEHPGAQAYSNDQPYVDGQAYSDPQQYETRRFPDGPAAPPPADDYPPDHSATQVYPASGGYPAPDASANPTEFLGPAAYSAQGGHARADHPRQSNYASQRDYQDQGYAQDQGYQEQGYADDDYYYDDPDDPYASTADRSSKTRSIVLPLLAAVAMIVVIGVVGAIGWQVFSSRNVAPTADRQSAATPPPASPQAAPPPATASASSTTPPVTSTPGKPKPVTLPAGAKACGQGDAVPGAFTQSATGSAATSCAFAEEVRRAYAAVSTAGSRETPRSVVATSPVTGRSYTMNCASEGQLVTCSGGDNAVVYVY